MYLACEILSLKPEEKRRTEVKKWVSMQKGTILLEYEPYRLINGYSTNFSKERSGFISMDKRRRIVTFHKLFGIYLFTSRHDVRNRKH